MCVHDIIILTPLKYPLPSYFLKYDNCHVIFHANNISKIHNIPQPPGNKCFFNEANVGKRPDGWEQWGCSYCGKKGHTVR